MMKYLHVAFLSLLSTVSTGQNFQDLKKNQPLLQSILKWNNEIVVESIDYKTKIYLKCELDSNKLTPIEILNHTNIVMLAESETYSYAVVNENNGFYLLMKDKSKTEWQKEFITANFKNSWNTKLIVYDKNIFIIDHENIHFRNTDKKWISASLKVLLNGRLPMYPSVVTVNCVITNDHITVAYDGGEWGSDVFQITYDVTADVLFKDVIHLGGAAQNIATHNGATFRCYSNATFNFYTLLKHQNNTTTLLLSSKKNNRFQIPPQNIVFCVANNGDILIAADRGGIFKLANDSLINLIETHLDFCYPMTGYFACSSPVAMLVEKDNIYIAHRSLGVFVYIKHGASYKFRQLYAHSFPL